MPGRAYPAVRVVEMSSTTLDERLVLHVVNDAGDIRAVDFHLSGYFRWSVLPWDG